jgi:hypothetical protein
VGCGGATTPIAPTLVATAAATPSNEGVQKWTISGIVRDTDDGSVVEGVSVQLSDRFEPRAAVTDATGRYRFDNVAESGVGMVFSRAGYRRLTIEQVLPVQDLVVNVGLTRDCVERPAPVPLSYTVSGKTVTFTWPQVDGALEYRLAVGQWEYVSPVFSEATTSTSYQWVNAPSGTYHARVQGRGACGYGNAANELKVIVP